MDGKIPNTNLGELKGADLHESKREGVLKNLVSKGVIDSDTAKAFKKEFLTGGAKAIKEGTTGDELLTKMVDEGKITGKQAKEMGSHLRQAKEDAEYGGHGHCFHWCYSCCHSCCHSCH